MTKKNLRILSNPHAYFQTMTKTHVQFQTNRHKTVGGVAHTRTYYFKGGGGRKDGHKKGRSEGRNAENYVPPPFFEKARDNSFSLLYISLTRLWRYKSISNTKCVSALFITLLYSKRISNDQKLAQSEPQPSPLNLNGK